MLNYQKKLITKEQYGVGSLRIFTQVLLNSALISNSVLTIFQQHYSAQQPISTQHFRLGFKEVILPQ